MASKTNKKRKALQAEEQKRAIKKKTSPLTIEGISYIDYKDINLLRKFMSERGKIRARRVNGNDQKQQAELGRAIRNAREMALLPYTVRQVTSRKAKKMEKEGIRPTGDRTPPEPRAQNFENEEALPDPEPISEDQLKAVVAAEGDDTVVNAESEDTQ